MQLCEERRRRLEAYETSAARLKLTEKALRAARATVSQQEYARVLGYNEQAQGQSENSRLELEHHIAQHHC
jgi:hypothetical protein